MTLHQSLTASRGPSIKYPFCRCCVLLGLTASHCTVEKVLSTNLQMCVPFGPRCTRPHYSDCVHFPMERYTRYTTATMMMMAAEFFSVIFYFFFLLPPLYRPTSDLSLSLFLRSFFSWRRRRHHHQAKTLQHKSRARNALAPEKKREEEASLLPLNNSRCYKHLLLCRNVNYFQMTENYDCCLRLWPTRERREHWLQNDYLFPPLLRELSLINSCSSKLGLGFMAPTASEARKRRNAK